MSALHLLSLWAILPDKLLKPQAIGTCAANRDDWQSKVHSHAQRLARAVHTDRRQVSRAQEYQALHARGARTAT